jgi:hypothetical protein
VRRIGVAFLPNLLGASASSSFGIGGLQVATKINCIFQQVVKLGKRRVTRLSTGLNVLGLENDTRFGAVIARDVAEHQFGAITPRISRRSIGQLTNGNMHRHRVTACLCKSKGGNFSFSSPALRY